MKINSRFSPNIFRAYDIRGAYPREINEEIAYKVGLAFAEFVKKEKRNIRKLDVLIGRDNRPSSPALFKGAARGIMDAGINVVSLGVCTAPMFYFASQYYKFDDAGLMITASHLSRRYNGFKLSREVPSPIDSQTGLAEIKKMVIGGEGARLRPSNKGKLIKKNILDEYVKFVLKELSSKKLVPLRVVIDTGNAPTGLVIPRIFKKTRIRTFHIFSKLNSDFPNRALDCTKARNLKGLKKEVLKRKADLGVAFDGDGDRIVFLDEKGTLLSPSVIAALAASLILRKNPGEKIIYTPNQSRIVEEAIKENKGKAVMGRVGHSNIKQKMKKDDILFGAEYSSHYYLRSHYFCESPFFVLFKILEELSGTKKRLSELTKPFQKYYHSGEINLKIENKKGALRALENRFRRGKISKIDGLRVDFPDWWFNIRPSHTEAVVRLVVEAKSRLLMEGKKKELIRLIAPFSF